MLDYRILYREYNKYKDFALQAFAYLNGGINPQNICVVKLDYYDKNNFAEFKKPNLISIKLGSIVDNLYYEPEAVKKGMIMLTVAHEMVHSVQAASMIKYSIDPAYAKMVEEHAQYTAQEYLKARKHEIQDIFGFDIQMGISYYGEMSRPNFHIEFNPEEYYINTILDLFMGNKINYRIKLERVFAIPTVKITFDRNTVTVKENGVYLENGVRDVNAILIKYRQGDMAMNIVSTFSAIPTYSGEDVIEVEIVFDVVRVMYFPLQISE